MRDAWRRAQAWAPEFVAEDLHAARELAEEYRRDAVIWLADAMTHPLRRPVHQQWFEQRRLLSTGYPTPASCGQLPRLGTAASGRGRALVVRWRHR